MECRFKRLGCNFISLHVQELAAHEKTVDNHQCLFSFRNIYDLTGEYRSLKNELFAIMSRDQNDDRESIRSTRSIQEMLDNEDSHEDIESSDSPEEDDDHHSISSCETSASYSNDTMTGKKARKKVTVSHHNSFKLVSIPYVDDGSVKIVINETHVFADRTDHDTFPSYMESHDTEHLEFPESKHSFSRLQYPSVVVDNGHSNTFIRIRFQVIGQLQIEYLQFGLANARGIYLKRLVSGTRHMMKDYYNCTGSSATFSHIHFKRVADDTENQFELLLQFRDFSQNNIFKGHYRDLRVFMFHMNSSAICSYDASSIFRVSPNKLYISEKQLENVVHAMKWNMPPPELPPLVGRTQMTLRMEFDQQSASRFKKSKTLFKQ